MNILTIFTLVIVIMKRIVSIVFVVIVIISGIHFSFATHYCGGKIASTNFSLTGEKASCGMEATQTNCPPTRNQISSNCCDDEILVFALDNVYTPDWFQKKNFTENIVRDFFILDTSAHSNYYFSQKAACTNVRPPGSLLISAVSISDICVFRI